MLRYKRDSLRVIAINLGFESLIAEAFDQIRDSAKNKVAVLSRLLDALTTIGSVTNRADNVSVLNKKLEWIVELVDRDIESSLDRTQLEKRMSEVRKTLKTAQSGVR